MASSNFAWRRRLYAATPDPHAEHGQPEVQDAVREREERLLAGPVVVVAAVEEHRGDRPERDRHRGQVLPPRGERATPRSRSPSALAPQMPPRPKLTADSATAMNRSYPAPCGSITGRCWSPTWSARCGSTRTRSGWSRCRGRRRSTRPARGCRSASSSRSISSARPSRDGRAAMNPPYAHEEIVIGYGNHLALVVDDLDAALARARRSTASSRPGEIDRARRRRQAHVRHRPRRARDRADGEGHRGHRRRASAQAAGAWVALMDARHLPRLHAEAIA